MVQPLDKARNNLRPLEDGNKQRLVVTVMGRFWQPDRRYPPMKMFADECRL